MKYINKITKEVVEPKTYAEKYVCEHNSDFEIYVEPAKEEKVVKPTKLKKEVKDED